MIAVSFIATTSSFHATDGKILSLAAFLQRDGFAVSVVCWSDEVEAGCKALSLAYMRIALHRKEIDRVKASEGFYKLLGDRQIIAGKDAPTWAELLAFDDFYGLVTAVDITGTESLRPDVVVMPMPGGESSTEDDEQLRVVLHRWAKQNHLPILGLEVERLDHAFEIIRFPVDMALLKRPYAREHAPVQFPLTPLASYFCRRGRDSHIEQVAMQEPDLLNALEREPGHYYLTIYFHLYYLSETIELLKELKTVWKECEEAGFRLVFALGQTHRRGLTEREMLEKGLAPWLAGLPYIVVENGNLLSLGLLSEAVLWTHPNSTMDVLRNWGVKCLQRGELSQLRDLTLGVRPQEALCYLVEQAQTKKEVA